MLLTFYSNKQITSTSSSILGSRTPLPIPKSLRTMWVNLRCSFHSSPFAQRIPNENKVKSKLEFRVFSFIIQSTQIVYSRNSRIFFYTKEYPSKNSGVYMTLAIPPYQPTHPTQALQFCIVCQVKESKYGDACDCWV